MDHIFYPAKNKSRKFTLLKHAYSTRLKSSKHAKMSAIMLRVIMLSVNKLSALMLNVIIVSVMMPRLTDR
jgi:hypothetical protein